LSHGFHAMLLEIMRINRQRIANIMAFNSRRFSTGPEMESRQERMTSVTGGLVVVDESCRDSERSAIRRLYKITHGRRRRTWIGSSWPC